jgi:hypothetical protein
VLLYFLIKVFFIRGVGEWKHRCDPAGSIEDQYVNNEGLSDEGHTLKEVAVEVAQTLAANRAVLMR